ncbi:MAG: DUF1572 family protein [Candidatus Hydrogenedentes bacterium]|nr:DUF1572 family protein [Candidatus Hydrogenedentota bacterium]
MKSKQNPYRHLILVCTGDSCADKKAKKLRDEIRELLEERGLDDEVRCSRTDCLGKCGDGPNVVVSPGDRWFKGVKPKDAKELLDAVLHGTEKHRTMDSNTLGAAYLESIVYRFEGAKELGDKALAQTSDDDLTWRPDEESNSIAVIVQHLHGNMLSRWTDFLTTDGEKPTRNRDGEFVEPESATRSAILAKWEQGWACMLSTLRALKPDDLLKDVTIRGQKLTVLDAIQRQLAHVPYHVGQIVYLARMRKGAEWQTLSIARGQSGQYVPQKRD